MKSQDFAAVGVIEGKDNLVIIDEHRVQEDLDEPLPAVNVGVVHLRKLVQEEHDMFLLLLLQYEKYGSMLTLETLGQRWKWEKTKIWRFFLKFASYFSLHWLPGSYGCVIFNVCYPTVDEFEEPGGEEVMRILELIRIKARNTHTAGTDNELLNRFVAWKSRKVIRELEDAYTQNEFEKSSDFRD